MTASFIGPLFDSKARVISLLGDINENDVNRVIDHLLRCDAASAEPITAFVNCRGGDIIEALKIVDAVGLLRSPLTAVALGLVEGAGILLLASAQNRVLFPSALISTAGLWDLPALHQDSRGSIGLHATPNGNAQLRRQVVELAIELISSANGKLPGFIADPTAPPQILDAPTAIQMGLADAILTGPLRLLTKTKSNPPSHARTRNVPNL